MMGVHPLCLKQTRGFSTTHKKLSSSSFRWKSLQTYPQQMNLWAMASPSWTQPETIFSTAARFGFLCGYIVLPQLYLLLLRPGIFGQYLYLISGSHIRKHIQGRGRWLRWSQKSCSFFAVCYSGKALWGF